MRLYQLANARIMPNNKTLPKLSFLKEHSFILLCLPVGWGSTVYTAPTMDLPGSGKRFISSWRGSHYVEKAHRTEMAEEAQSHKCFSSLWSQYVS